MFNKYIEEREGKFPNQGPGAPTGAGGGQRFEPPNPVVRGLAILAAILFSISMVLGYQALRAEALPKKILIRSSYNQIELRLQQLATARESYVVCMADEKCGVKLAFFEDAVRQFKIVEPVGFAFDTVTSKLKGTLRYSGDDLKVLPREISIQLPKDILSVTRVGCPANEPLLAGVDAEGKPVCRAIAKTMCEDGEYVTSIDPVSLNVSCAPIGKAVGCAEGEFLSSFEWQGEDRVVYSCKSRLNPFVAWKFVPAVKSGPALSDVGSGQ